MSRPCGSPIQLCVQGVGLRNGIEVVPFLCVRARPGEPFIQACLEEMDLRAGLAYLPGLFTYIPILIYILILITLRFHSGP